MKRTIALLLAAGLAIGLAACTAVEKPETQAGGQTSEAGAEAIKIGAWEPLTGQMASGGSQIKDGYDMAHALRPTVLGRPVELVVADNKSDKVEAANSMTRLVEQDKVVAVLGCYSSGLTIAGVAITEKAKIPCLPLATSPMVTDGRSYVVRTNYQDPVAGTVMAQFAFQDLGLKTAVVIRDVTSDYSVGLANFFIKAFNEAAGSDSAVAGVYDFNGGDQDFTAQLNTAKAANPDVIFLPVTYNDAALICKQAREMGLSQIMMGGDSCEAPELIAIGGKDVEDFYFCSHFAAASASTESAKQFLALYEEKFPGQDVSSNTVIGFENYNLLLDAIEATGGTDAEALNDWLHNVKDWEGVTGLITIDPESGNPIKAVPISVVRGGRFEYVNTIMPQ